MDAIQRSLITRVRRVDVRLSNVLDAYNRIIEFLINFYSSKKGVSVDEFDEILDLLSGNRSVLEKADQSKQFKLVLRLGRMVNNQLDAGRSSLRMRLVRFLSAYEKVIVGILDFAKSENSKIGYEEKVRRIKGVPVYYFKFKSSKLDSEAEEKAADAEIKSKKSIEKRNEKLVEVDAAHNGHVIERKRILGRVVNIGMTPEDQDKMDDLIAPLNSQRDRMKRRISRDKKTIDELRVQSGKSSGSEKNAIENQIFDRQTELNGKFSGGWTDSSGVSGSWSAFKESTGPVMKSSRVAVEASRTLGGVWKFQGISDSVVRVYITDNGNVRSIGRTHMSGRLYLEGGKLSGWLKFKAKRRVDLGEAMKSNGLNQDLSDIQGSISEVRNQFDRYVYDTTENENGVALVPMEEWEENRRSQVTEMKKLNNVHKIGTYLAKYDDQKVDENVVDDAVDKQTVNWVALTDDKIPSSVALTKMFPIVEINGKRIVAGGDFKGFPVDILINKAGRFLKGSAYSFDGEGSVKKIEYRDDNGEMDYCIENEPYLTADERGGLIVVLPSGETGDMVEKVLKDLSKISGTIHENRDAVRKYSRTRVYSVSSVDVDDMKELVGSFSMSQAASKLMSEYYEKIKRAKEVEVEKSIGDFTADKIPGLKKFLTDDNGNSSPVRLSPFQSKAIEYVMHKGNGVVGLDTGLGKSVSSISILLCWMEDGTLDKGNGQVLYVVPASLRGNIPTEIRKFCENPMEILSRIETMSYDEFRKTPHSKLEQYSAIFFDEAQQLKNALGNSPSAVGRHALTLNHPRKVLMTASVLEKSPGDLYNLAMIANNEINIDPELAMEKRRQFLGETCIMAGNRPVAVKNTKASLDRMQAWVKSNCLYVDKESVRDEIGLTSVTPQEEQTTGVQMTDEMISAYQKVADGIDGTLQRMRVKYLEKRSLGSGELQELVVQSGVMGDIIQLREISNDLGLYVEKQTIRKLAKELFGKNLLEGDKLTQEEKEEINIEVSKIPDFPNPKIDECKRVVTNSVGKSKRTVVWTDQPSLAVKAGKELADSMPGKSIAVCLSNRIDVYSSGGQIINYQGTRVDICVPVNISGENSCSGKASFGPSDKYVYPDGSSVPRKEWQKYIMDYVLKPDANIAALVLTSSYTTGHNLQFCSTVVHLDRDSWNNEVMKQRTARCYRRGQKNPVNVEIIDAMLPEGMGIAVNEIQKWMQEMEEKLFDKIVRDSMSGKIQKYLVRFNRAQQEILGEGKMSDRDLNAFIVPSTENVSNLPGVTLDE